MTTIATSVTVVDGPLPDAAALDARLAELRRRFPRAIIDRYLATLPTIGERALIFPGAAVVGDVRLGDDVSVWYGCVLRGDLRPVTVGARTNVQDGTVVHVADDGPCDIGADCIIGHRAMIHACRIEDACLIGMQATILDNAVVGAGSVVGAGARRHAADGDPAAQPGAGHARQGREDADRRRGGLPPRPRREVRPPEGKLPPRRASLSSSR